MIGNIPRFFPLLQTCTPCLSRCYRDIGGDMSVKLAVVWIYIG